MTQPELPSAVLPEHLKEKAGSDFKIQIRYRNNRDYRENYDLSSFKFVYVIY